MRLAEQVPIQERHILRYLIERVKVGDHQRGDGTQILHSDQLRGCRRFCLHRYGLSQTMSVIAAA
jgi:hypothetical protein